MRYRVTRHAGRRATTVLLATAVVLSSAGGTASADARRTDDSCPAGRVPSAGFSDTGGSTHAAAIDCLAWWRVTVGSGSGRYDPSGAVTRAQMASFIARLYELSGGVLPSSPPDVFDDDAGNPHQANINKLAAAGIVQGTGARSYSPDNVVSRAQMASFLVRAYESRTGTTLPPGGDAFADAAGAHAGSINKAAAAGFAAGTAPGQYSPSAPVRRDAMASFLTRVLDLLVEEGHTDAPAGQELPPPPPTDIGEPPAPPTGVEPPQMPPTSAGSALPPGPPPA